MKFPQECEDGGIIILYDPNEKEMNDPRVQTMCKRYRDIILSIFIIPQYYYELPKRTTRANGNIYRIFKANNFRGARNFYQAKASLHMTLNEFKYLTSSCEDKKYQPLTIDMTKDKFTGRYHLGLNSLYIPDSFKINKCVSNLM